MLSNLSERIAMARRHVLTGRAAIERQRDVIAKKYGRDFDTSASEQLLVQFETSQAIFEDHWERLLREQNKQ